jgi:hypothetical protein
MRANGWSGRRTVQGDSTGRRACHSDVESARAKNTEDRPAVSAAVH